MTNLSDSSPTPINVDACIEMPQKVASRNISAPVQCMLWGTAAGRCQFAGCNRPLWKSPVTQEPVNIAEKAHIYAFSPGGSRGHEGIDPEHLNQVANLMLVCHDCHRKMDQKEDGGRYTEDRLRGWKARHEVRVERVTGIDPGMQSHVALYGANIGALGAPLTYESTARALFPERYPAEDRPIELGVVDGVNRDDDPEFWREETRNLERRFETRLQQPLGRGEISHLSIFAMAPQALLIRLGTLLTDITEVEVFQRHREPATWEWLDDADEPPLQVVEPEAHQGPPALVIALSATVNDDRIKSVLGDPASIWRITVEAPHNDWLKSRSQLASFRREARLLMDKIKAVHGQDTPLHIFPAGPVAAAVELGRIRQPKADMPWRVYDQNNNLSGFAPAITIESGDAS